MSVIGLPMSSVSSTASVSASRSMSAAKRYITSMRARGAMRDHTPSRNARRPAATARSMSSAVPAAICARVSPVAGFTVAKRPPFAASTNWPSMNSRVSIRARAARAVDCHAAKS